MANQLMTLERENVAVQYRIMEARAKIAGRQLTYPVHDELAGRVVAAFRDDGVTCVSLLCPMQFGKTSILHRTAFLLTTTEEMIDPNNVFVLCGLNDIDWERQTKERLIEKWRPNVLHRPRIRSELVDRIGNKTNILLIIDESHIACEADHTISTILHQMGIMDIEFLTSRNIRILHVSATPSAVLVDMMRWTDKYHKKIVSKLPDNYVSFQTMFDEDRVKRATPLTSAEAIRNYFDDIANDPIPRYHIVRCVKENRDVFNMMKLIGYDYNFVVRRHDSAHRIENIDTLLDTPPMKHTLIVIMHFWRAARTLNDAHIGTCYENVAKAKCSDTEAQGLAGRLCGVGKRRGPDGPIIYSNNPQQLRNYMTLLANDFEYSRCDHNSRTLKTSKAKGIIRCKATMVHPEDVAGLVIHDDAADKIVHAPTLFVPIRRINTIKTIITIEIKTTESWLTTFERLSKEEFAARYSITETSSKTATVLMKHLKRHGLNANVSFTAQSAEKRSAVDNHYKKPQWSGLNAHVYFDRASADVTIVTKNMALLTALTDLTKIRDGPYYAYRHDGRVDVYECSH